VCRDLRSDRNNCGLCGTVCPPGQSCCSGRCVSLATDVSNCGRCGTVCPTGQPCIGGQCGCPAGTTLCNGRCVDLQNDSQNCGQCGTVCPPGTSCQRGSCLCPNGAPLCGAVCCPAGQSCSNGQCCPTGLTSCGGRCVDLRFDPSNCGACGRAVTNFPFIQNGQVVAVNLACSNGSPVCPPNYVSCPANTRMTCCPSSGPVCTGVTGPVVLADGTVRIAAACCPSNAPRAIFANGTFACVP
jgi:hypothetical protein